MDKFSKILLKKVEKERSARLNRTSFLLGRNPYGLAKTYLTIVYADGKAAVWIRADPGFISYARPLPSVIGQRQKHSLVALKAFWKILLHTFPTSLFPVGGINSCASFAPTFESKVIL